MYINWNEKNLICTNYFAISFLYIKIVLDLVPKTLFGKIFGSMCAISGIILVALPIALLANNFNEYYRMNIYETRIINIYSKKVKKVNNFDVIWFHHEQHEKKIS